MADDIWVARDHDSGDLAAVFEHDGETGFFYLYDISQGGHRIRGAIQVIRGPCQVSESELEVRWSKDGTCAGLFIGGALWAAFQGDARFGSLYVPGGAAMIPDEVVSAFREDQVMGQ